MSPELVFAAKWQHEKGRIVETQSHNCHEIVFYDRGSSGATIIDGMEYSFSAGDIVFNRKYSQHTEKHNSDGTCIFFGFAGNTSIESGIYKDMWEIKPLAEAIVKEAREQNKNYTDIISLKIQEVLLLIDRNNTSSTVKRNKSLFYCKNYIDENYMAKIEISTLAEMTNYSPDHFRHLFFRGFGISPKNYIIKKRCEKAIELLETTSQKCSDIAFQCGFSDSGQMSKMIKSIYSKTPQQIRADIFTKQN